MCTGCLKDPRAVRMQPLGHVHHLPDERNRQRPDTSLGCKLPSRVVHDDIAVAYEDSPLATAARCVAGIAALISICYACWCLHQTGHYQGHWLALLQSGNGQVKEMKDREGLWRMPVGVWNLCKPLFVQAKLLILRSARRFRHGACA
jgi:hypothetical protein